MNRIVTTLIAGAALTLTLTACGDSSETAISAEKLSSEASRIHSNDSGIESEIVCGEGVTPDDAGTAVTDCRLQEEGSGWVDVEVIVLSYDKDTETFDVEVR